MKDRFLTHNGARIRRVILYGSRAQGTVTLDSDFDFLVVEVDPVSKREEMRRLREAVEDSRFPFMCGSWVKSSLRKQKT